MHTFLTSDPRQLVQLRTAEVETAKRAFQAAKLSVVSTTERLELAMRQLEAAKAIAQENATAEHGPDCLCRDCYGAALAKGRAA